MVAVCGFPVSPTGGVLTHTDRSEGSGLKTVLLKGYTHITEAVESAFGEILDIEHVFLFYLEAL